MKKPDWPSTFENSLLNTFMVSIKWERIPLMNHFDPPGSLWMIHQTAASGFPMQSNYLQWSLAVFLPLHKSSFDFDFEPLLQPVYLPEPYPKPAKTNRSPLTLAQPLQSMEFCKMHGATFWERHRAGNFCLDSGQLLQGIYAFCRKKPCTACVQNCISKMHVQNCIKGASLEAMEAPIESKSCVHSRLSSKKKKNLVPNCTCVMNMGTVYRKITF